ncbi:hypothetical protein D1839_19255 [Roseburia sp. 1XD42-34]|nr:hypothetical protein [Roseburia sp. 1XD42-34]RKI74197.1 hypothetical protein D7V87_19240 [Clostridium sp. 1xD42-85]
MKNTSFQEVEYNKEFTINGVNEKYRLAKSKSYPNPTIIRSTQTGDIVTNAIGPHELMIQLLIFYPHHRFVSKNFYHLV